MRWGTTVMWEVRRCGLRMGGEIRDPVKNQLPKVKTFKLLRES